MIEPSRVAISDIPTQGIMDRMANIEALLLAILNQMRNGVKTQGLSLGVTVPIVSVPGLIEVTP